MGSVRMSSESGAGSTFQFEVQLRAGSLQLLKQQPRLPDALAVDWSSLRVLVQEDHPVNQKIALGLLTKLGIHADLAEKGDVAIGMTSVGHYDVVLMDMQTPVMDGIDATRAIRLLSLDFQTWIIAQTANAFDTDRERCLQAGMDDFLSKPFRLDALREKLEKGTLASRRTEALPTLVTGRCLRCFRVPRSQSQGRSKVGAGPLPGSVLPAWLLLPRQF